MFLHRIWFNINVTFWLLINIFILRFYDVKFDRPNASEIKNLTCGRVMLENRSNLIWWSKKENHWKKDPDCIMEWHEEGITCICKHVGTYALLRTKTYLPVSISLNLFREYILPTLLTTKKTTRTNLHLSRDGFSVMM